MVDFLEFKKYNIIEAIIALKNPTKLALGTRKKASFSIIALITKENKPKVKIVIGNEKNFIIGLTVMFNAPITIDNTINVPIEPIYIPFIKWEQIYKDNALKSKLIINLFIKSPRIFLMKYNLSYIKFYFNKNK